MPLMNLEDMGTEQLFERASSSGREARKKAIDTLCWRGTRDVLVMAQQRARAPEARNRILAARILGELGIPQRTFPAECTSELVSLLQDKRISVSRAAVWGLAHLNTETGLGHLCELSGDTDPNVRLAVAYGLIGHVANRAARESLIALTHDSDSDVRNWATFALASSRSKSRSVARALESRVQDEHDETRREAMLGLAMRGLLDVNRLIEEFRVSQDHPLILFEIAGHLKSRRLCPALRLAMARLSDDRIANCAIEALDRCGC